MPDLDKGFLPALASIVCSIPFDAFGLLGLDVNAASSVVGLPEILMAATGDLLRLFSRGVGLGVLAMLAIGELLTLTSRIVGLNVEILESGDILRLTSRGVGLGVLLILEDGDMLTGLGVGSDVTLLLALSGDLLSTATKDGVSLLGSTGLNDGTVSNEVVELLMLRSASTHIFQNSGNVSLNRTHDLLQQSLQLLKVCLPFKMQETDIGSGMLVMLEVGAVVSGLSIGSSSSNRK